MAVNSAIANAGVAAALITTHGLTGWAFPETVAMCHDGFILEFGWEFLVG
jgi:hypothetical protein